MTLAGRLPAFTWDRIASLPGPGRVHPDGPVDLSMGTPVDPVPEVVRAALAELGCAGVPGDVGYAAIADRGRRVAGAAPTT